jgi:ACR3 family arsenite transporter
VPPGDSTFFIFYIAYLASRALKLPHTMPRGRHDRAFNFFELAVAVAITLFATKSPVALATIVGVWSEVPVMLTLVKIANRTKGGLPRERVCCSRR